MVLGVVASGSAQFVLFAAETFSGSLGNNTAAYGGVRRYDFAGNGAPSVQGTGIPASSLSDPAGLTVSGNTLYVGNRHGNTLGQGSVQQFAISGTSLTGGATIAAAGSAAHQGFHGFSFAPNGDLFVSTVSGGSRRYRNSGSGFTDIGGTAAAMARDTWVSPDGQMLVETVGGDLRFTPIVSNSLGTSTTVNVAGSAVMHQLAFRNGSLYASAFDSTGNIYRIDLDANNNFSSATVVASAPTAIGLAFSPDGNEMFVAGHTTNAITRFLWSGTSWVNNGSIGTGVNNGYLAVYAVPEPGTIGALGLGIAALLRRRRTPSRR